LHDPDAVGRPHVDVHVKAEPLGVVGLGPIDVTDGHRHELEQEHAGTHRGRRAGWAYRIPGLGSARLAGIGLGHGIPPGLYTVIGIAP
jgi:hypothetical protein